MRRANQSAKSAKRRAGMLGLGFDHHDGHTRITRGENFFLCGGSQDTHAIMQETAVKVNEKLEKKGKQLDDVSVGELRDICHEVVESIGQKPRSGKPPSE